MRSVSAVSNVSLGILLRRSAATATNGLATQIQSRVLTDNLSVPSKRNFSCFSASVTFSGAALQLNQFTRQFK